MKAFRRVPKRDTPGADPQLERWAVACERGEAADRRCRGAGGDTDQSIIERGDAVAECGKTILRIVLRNLSNAVSGGKRN
jgi:hypothetical protein